MEDIRMIALTMTGIKDFMSQLLLKDTFDSFCFIEGEIVTFNTFTIDGFIHKDFFDTDAELPKYSYWKNIREHCFALIRGKRTPLSFRFVFSLSPKNIARLIEQNGLSLDPGQVQGLYLNIRYDGSSLACVTGSSFKTFTMDRTLEHAWDEMVKKFFLQKGIAFEN